MNKSAFMLDTGCGCIKTTVLFDRLQTAAIGGGSREIPNRWVIESVVHFLNLNRKTVRYSIIHQHVALFKARRLEGITKGGQNIGYFKKTCVDFRSQNLYSFEKRP